eukprot:gene4616-6494_t
MTSLQLSSSSLPNDYDGVETKMQQSLQYIFESSLPCSNRLSIDLLTPGLNPRMEQKAMLMQEFLFDLVAASFKVLEQRFSNIVIVFTSTGDVASFQKHCFRWSISVSDKISLADLASIDRIANQNPNGNINNENTDVDCVLIVAAKNNVGDPVIRTISRLCLNSPNIQFLFLNCDLSDKVATGMKDKSVRDDFRSSIQPAFYFRNIVRTSRPSLVPTEVGALIYTAQNQWEIFLVNENDIYGPGSLNRFMKQAMFARDPNDPTAFNPPRYVKAGTYFKMPTRDELDSIVSKAENLIARAEREQAARIVALGMKSTEDVSDEIISLAAADKILDYISRGYKDTKIESIIAACIYLSENSSSTRLSLIPTSSIATTTLIPDDNVLNDSLNSVSSESVGNQRMGLLDLESSDASTVSVSGKSSSTSFQNNSIKNKIPQLYQNSLITLELVFEIVIPSDIIGLTNPNSDSLAKNCKINYFSDSKPSLELNFNGNDKITKFIKTSKAMFGITKAQLTGVLSPSKSIPFGFDFNVENQKLFGMVSRPPITADETVFTEQVIHSEKDKFYLLRSYSSSSSENKFSLWIKA